MITYMLIINVILLVLQGAISSSGLYATDLSLYLHGPVWAEGLSVLTNRKEKKRVESLNFFILT